MKIGLALGGGGARGLAHLLVLEVFDDFGSIMATLESEFEPGKHQIWKGKAKPATHFNIVPIHSVIEMIQESAYDDYGEWAEDYLYGLKSEDVQELRKVISDFLLKKTGPVSFWDVENIEEMWVSTELADIGLMPT